MPAINEEVCKQKVDEGGQDDAQQERQQTMRGEEVDQAGQDRVAAHVYAEPNQAAGHELSPLAHVGLPMALVEGEAPVEAPVPGDRRPEGQETRQAVLEAQPLQGKVNGDIDHESAGSHQDEAEQPSRPAELVPVQAVEVTHEVKLLPPVHLAGAQAAVAEVDGQFLDAQLPAHHELQGDLVADGLQRLKVGQRPAVGREEPGHGIGATDER